MSPKKLHYFDLAYCLRRQEIVLTWPESAHKTAVLDAIMHRICALGRLA